MSEKEEVFSSKIKYDGVFSFKNFYKFCYDWLVDETGMMIKENKYSEKLSGNSKNIEIEWVGIKKVTDYFKYEVKINFRIIGLTEVEVTEDGQKTKSNKGSIEIKVSGNLIRDYQGKFEQDSFRKFLRSIYEKWVIPARIEQYEEKLAGDCDEFLAQAKAYVDLEGKR